MAPDMHLLLTYEVTRGVERGGVSWAGTVAMIDLRVPGREGGRRRGRGRRRWDGTLRGEGRWRFRREVGSAARLVGLARVWWRCGRGRRGGAAP